LFATSLAFASSCLLLTATTNIEILRNSSNYNCGGKQINPSTRRRGGRVTASLFFSPTEANVFGISFSCVYVL
jgi:hypothetical protein